MLRQLKIATGFLTILPSGQVVYSKEEIAESASAFPLVGLLQGLLLAITAYCLHNSFSAYLVAGIIETLYIFTTGAFHLDGLSDTFDALASRKDRTGMLEVMKDPASGPVGVVAIVLVIVLKILLIGNMTENTYEWWVYLICFPVIGKWSMVTSIHYGDSARPDGLGMIMVFYHKRKHFIQSIFYTTIIFTALILIESESATSIIPALLCVYIFVRLVTRYFNRRLGGITGDILGMIAEVSEVVFLIVVILAGG